MNAVTVTVITLRTRNRKHHRTTAKLAACADYLSGPNLACDSGPVVCTYRLNFIWIGVLSPMRGKKYCNVTKGKPKRTCREVVQKDCQARKLNREDAMDHRRWRKLINDG